jgi:hypothetical protein
MVINHAVTIPSANNAPNPTGTPVDANQPNPTSDNPWNCAYPCTKPGHTDTVLLLWDGQYFSLPDSEANDPNFGTVSFTYVPPLV